MRFLRPLIICLFLLCSCNTYKFADQKTAKALHKKNFDLHSIESQKFILTFWDSGGKKPVLVLLHGFGTSGKFQWYKQANLSKNYRVIIVNLLYFGSSSRVPDHGIQEQIEALETLLINQGITSFYLCGSSYGGVVAAEFALRHPGKVKKLLLLDVPLKYLRSEDTKIVCEKYDVADPQELYIPSSPTMLRTLTEITYDKKSRMPMKLLKEFYKNNYEVKLGDLTRLYESYLKESKVFVNKEYKFTMPVLLIWGSKDELVPIHVAQELKEHIGNNARLEIVSRSAHLPNLENPKAVKKLMRGFFK